VFIIYVGDTGDVVRRIQADHCGDNTNVEASSLRERLADNVGYQVSKTKRPSGSIRKRLDLPEPHIGEQLISSYTKSGVWKFVICSSAREAKDFQWYVIEGLKPLLNIKHRPWKTENVERYRSLLASLLSSPSLRYDQLDGAHSGPGVYVLYHESQPKDFILADKRAG